MFSLESLDNFGIPFGVPACGATSLGEVLGVPIISPEVGAAALFAAGLSMAGVCTSWEVHTGKIRIVVIKDNSNECTASLTFFDLLKCTGFFTPLAQVYRTPETLFTAVRNVVAY
jgi:hypothetical protein